LRPRHSILACLFLALSLGVVLAAEPIHVLCLAARDTRVQGLDAIDPAALAAYREAGYVLHLDYYEEVAPEALHRYPIVVGMIAQLHQGTRAVSDELAAAIDGYVRAGGGFILIPGPSYYGVADFTEQLNPWLAPYGAELLNEIPLDPSRQIEDVQILAYRYLCTTNLLSHPVTEGIDELLLPLDYANSYVRTHTMRLAPGWDVLVRGESTTASFPFGQTDPALRSGTWSHAPPLLAVRDWGKGHLAIFTTASRHFIWDAYHRAHGSGLVMKHGGLRLMCNLFDYVSAAGYARAVTPPPAAAATLVAGNVPIAVDKMAWLSSVLSTRLPPGYSVSAYIDCGAVSDRPYRSGVGAGYLASDPSRIVRWSRAFRFHATAANARLITKDSLRYRFDGLTSGVAYRVMFVHWDYSGDAGRAVRVAWGDKSLENEWLPSRFEQKQGPRLESITLPAEAVTNGSIEVTFSLGSGGEGTTAALGELWLLAPGQNDESAETLMARCEPPDAGNDLLLRPTPIYRGLIGARSLHGGGVATVSNMVEAARQAGLDFLVFTDPVASLTSDRYEALVRDCREASSTNFAALPGIRFKDGYEDTPLPPDQQRGRGHVSAYSFQSIERLPDVSDFGNPYALLWKFLGGAFSGGKNAVPTLMQSRDSTISPFFQRFWRGLDLFTFDCDGAAHGDARALYRDLLAGGYGPYPRVSGDYRSPAAITAAAKGWHTLVHATRRERIGAFHYASMVSNGPRFEGYAFTSDQTTNGESGGGQVFCGHTRIYLHLDASHTVPLTRVTLYHNDAVVRRWYPHTRRFTVVEPLLITTEGDLMTHIEAADGSEAYSGRFHVVEQGFYCSMCGDNQNTIASLARVPSRFVYDEREIFLQHSNWHTGQAAGQVGMLKDARELVPRIIETGIIQPCKYFRPCPRIRFSDGHTEDHVESELRIRSASGDHHVITYDFNPPGNHFRSRTALTVYRPAVDGATATLVETELTAQQDIPAGTLDSIGVLALAMMPPLAPAWRYTCTDVGNNLVTEAFASIVAGEQHRHALAPGSPLMLWPSDAGNLVVIPLDATAYQAEFSNLKGVWNGREHVELTTPGRAFAAGETHRTAFLVLLWPGSITSPEQLRALVTRYTANATVTGLTPGTTVQTGYRIRMVGRHGAAATVATSVQRRDALPLTLDGVNPHWTCAVERDGVLRVAPSGGSLLHTVVEALDQPFRVAAGNLLTADDPDLVIEWGSRAPGVVYFYAHNPRATSLATTVRTNPIFSSLVDAAVSVSLAPGQGRWYRATAPQSTRSY